MNVRLTPGRIAAGPNCFFDQEAAPFDERQFAAKRRPGNGTA
jgi:hypothetical protein